MIKRLILRPLKNLSLGWKLSGSYVTLIVIFILLGIFFIIKLHDLRYELRRIERSYIPLIDKTRQIESYTNQVMYSLWEYTEFGKDVYYHQSKTSLENLRDVVDEIKDLLEMSEDLATLQSRLNLIEEKLDSFDELINQTAIIHYNIEQNQQSLIRIRNDFTEKAKLFLYEQENKLRKAIQNEVFPPALLAEQHRKSRLINLVVDKGNSNLIRAFESQVSGNNEDLDEAFRQFVYINRLLNEINEISDDSTARGRVAGLREYFKDFKHETEMLNDYLIGRRTILEKRVELADAVLHEARMMGKQGMELSENVMSSGVEDFSRVTTFYLFGLLLAVLFAGGFAIAITRSITIPVSKSVSFAQEIAGGNLNAKIDVKKKTDELGVLIHSLKTMGNRLNQKVHELKKMERSMVGRIIETEEKERQRFAEDIHDSLGPLLSTIKLYINTIQNDNYNEQQKKDMIVKADEVIDEAIISAKNIANNLLPNVLKDFGLDKAIGTFCEKIKEVNIIQINYQCLNYYRNLSQNTETMLFRVVKELINNTIKHAHARNINITLDMDGDFLKLDYADDGIGFDIKSVEDNSAAKHGIQNIFSRINTINGTIHFSKGNENGVQVKIHVPLT